jgi:uncharacterized membrane protein
MLVPAGFLVMLLLAAIAVDQAQVHLRQRQAQRLAVDLANDLVTLGLDEAAFRAEGRYRLDPHRVSDLAHELAAAGDLARWVTEVHASVPDPETVTVTITARVEYIFAPAIPGAPHEAKVTGRATAVARAG